MLSDEDREEVKAWVKKQRIHFAYLAREFLPFPKEICVDSELYKKLKEHVKEQQDVLGQEPSGNDEGIMFRRIPLVSREYDRSLVGAI